MKAVAAILIGFLAIAVLCILSLGVAIIGHVAAPHTSNSMQVAYGLACIAGFGAFVFLCYMIGMYIISLMEVDD